MKYYVDYMTKDGDYCKVWVVADSEDEAISEAYSEYWDIHEIVSVYKA